MRELWTTDGVSTQQDATGVGRDSQSDIINVRIASNTGVAEASICLKIYNENMNWDSRSRYRSLSGSFSM